VARGVFALAAANLEKRTDTVVRICVIEEQAAGTPWAEIGKPFGISSDAARKRWGRWELANRADHQP
jgi:hypothetical protein